MLGEEGKVERKVKGSFLIDYVRMIKSRKDIDWSKHFSPQDLAFLQKRLSATEWYPLEVFERIGMVIFKEIAHSDLNLARLWGRIRAEELAKTHNTMVCPGNAHETLVRFHVVRQELFNYDPVKVRVFFKNYAKLEIAFQVHPMVEEPSTYQALGYFERLLELSGAVNVQHHFLSKSWAGDKSTVLELFWSNVKPEMKVKGSLFVDYVRMIKSRKEVDWGQYLLAKDLPFLSQQILPSEWYPFDSFERMGLGILKEIAQDDVEAVLAFGQISVNEMVKELPSLICANDPRESLMRFQVYRKSFFNFDAVIIQALYSDYAKIQIEYSMSRTAEEAACYQAVGFFIQLLRLSGAKQVDYKFLSKSWEGDPTSILELRWQ